MLALTPGAGYIDLHIDFLNLMPGRYSLSLWIQSQGDRRVHDLLEHVVVLDIETANIHQAGRHFDHRSGLVFFPCSWEIAR